MSSASFVDDLGADSLRYSRTGHGVRRAFDIEIPDEDAEKIRTGAGRGRLHLQVIRKGGSSLGRRVVVTGLG